MSDDIPPQAGSPTTEEQPPPPARPGKPLRQRTMPFSSWWAVLAGATTGVLVRQGVFDGVPGGAFHAMQSSFIYLAPFLAGAVAVFVAELTERRSWGYYIGIGALSSLLFIIGTLLILLEGLICAVLIVPVFVTCGAAGGLLMGAICRLTVWAKQSLFGLAALPIILGSLETGAPPDHFEIVERTVTIQAPAAALWEQIHNTTAVDHDRLATTWIYAIGAPKPLSGISRATAQGHVRTVQLQKGAHFEQEFLDWQPARYARWRFVFTPDSFPPGTLDDHVIIGGHYFDLLDGELRMTPRGPSTTVTLRVRYRVSTQFNWYAVPLARALVGNLQDSLLDYYGKSAAGHE
jgi:hypothetical protein